MKVLNVAIVIVLLVPFRLSTRIGLAGTEQRIDFISETVCQLLTNADYRTVNFFKFMNDTLSDDLLSTIAHKYNRLVEVYTGNHGTYRAEDAAVLIVNSDLLESLSMANIKRINFLLLIANMVNQTEILSLFRTIHVARITMVSFDSMDSAAINISTILRHKTNNCEHIQIFNASFLPTADSDSVGKNFSSVSCRTDFKGCLLDVGIVSMAPFTINMVYNRELIYSGVEVEMIRVLGERFNFNIRFIHPPKGTKWGNLNKNGSFGLMGMLQDGKVDFAIGSITRTLTRNTLLKGGVGSFYDQIVFAVPPGIPYTPLQQLARPVTTHGWILIIMTCITVSLLFSFDTDEHLCSIHFETCKKSLTDVWSVLLGGAKLHPPKKVFGRYLLVGWLMTTLVYRTAYQAILFEHLRCGIEFKPILTLEEMFGAGLQYYMYNISQRFFVRNPRIMMRSVIVNDDVSLKNILTDIADNKLMVAFPLPKTIIEYFNKQRLAESKVHVSRYIIESSEVAIHYPIESHLTVLFDDMVLRIRAVGLHDCWARKYRENIVDNSVEHHKFQLQNLLGAFIIHGVLCGFSCIIFLIELMIADDTHYLIMKI